MQLSAMIFMKMNKDNTAKSSGREHLNVKQHDIVRKTYNGVLKYKTFVAIQFSKYTAVVGESSQWQLGTCASINKVYAVSKICRFFLLAMLFYCRV